MLHQASDLLEFAEDRYDKGSLIITSQVPVDRGHDLIGVPTLADAILDRIGALNAINDFVAATPRSSLQNQH
jgi:hypothetical protein